MPRCCWARYTIYENRAFATAHHERFDSLVVRHARLVVVSGAREREYPHEQRCGPAGRFRRWASGAGASRRTV